MLNQTMLTDSSKKLWKQKNIIERESTKENQLNKGYGLQKSSELLKTAKQIPGDSLILITKFPESSDQPQKDDRLFQFWTQNF